MSAQLAPNETALPVPSGGASEYAWDGYYRVVYFGASGRVYVGTAGDFPEAVLVAERHRTGHPATITGAA